MTHGTRLAKSNSMPPTSQARHPETWSLTPEVEPVPAAFNLEFDVTEMKLKKPLTPAVAENPKE